MPTLNNGGLTDKDFLKEVMRLNADSNALRTELKALSTAEFSQVYTRLLTLAPNNHAVEFYTAATKLGFSVYTQTLDGLSSSQVIQLPDNVIKNLIENIPKEQFSAWYASLNEQAVRRVDEVNGGKKPLTERLERKPLTGKQKAAIIAIAGGVLVGPTVLASAGAILSVVAWAQVVNYLPKMLGSGHGPIVSWHTQKRWLTQLGGGVLNTLKHAGIGTSKLGYNGALRVAKTLHPGSKPEPILQSETGRQP